MRILRNVDGDMCDLQTFPAKRTVFIVTERIKDKARASPARQTQRFNAAQVNEDMGNNDQDMNRLPASDRLTASETKSWPEGEGMNVPTRENLADRWVGGEDLRHESNQGEYLADPIIIGFVDSSTQTCDVPNEETPLLPARNPTPSDSAHTVQAVGRNAGVRAADEVIDDDPGILKESRLVPHKEPTSPHAVEPGIGEAEVQGEKDPRTVEKNINQLNDSAPPIDHSDDRRAAIGVTDGSVAIEVIWDS